MKGQQEERRKRAAGGGMRDVVQVKPILAVSIHREQSRAELVVFRVLICLVFPVRVRVEGTV